MRRQKCTCSWSDDPCSLCDGSYDDAPEVERDLDDEEPTDYEITQAENAYEARLERMSEKF